VLNAVIAFFTPPPKIGRKKIWRRPNFVFPVDFRPAELFSAGPNFSAAAANFGG